jgi:hypothetical protein
MTPGAPDDVHTVAVQLARVEVKLDNITTTVHEHGKMLEALKARRFPLPVISALGSAVVVYTALRGGR